MGGIGELMSLSLVRIFRKPAGLGRAPAQKAFWTPLSEGWGPHLPPSPPAPVGAPALSL